MSGDFRKSKVIERLSNMNQNIPAPERGPEQATQRGDTAAWQLSVQGTKQLCLQCPQVVLYIILGSGDNAGEMYCFLL